MCLRLNFNVYGWILWCHTYEVVARILFLRDENLAVLLPWSVVRGWVIVRVHPYELFNQIAAFILKFIFVSGLTSILSNAETIIDWRR